MTRPSPSNSPSSSSTQASLSPSSLPSQTTTSSNPHVSNGHSPHPNLPMPPPLDRRPPSRGKSRHKGDRKLRLMRKGRDKHKAIEDEEWTLEGSTWNGHGMDSPAGARQLEPTLETLYDSQLTEVPPPREKEGKKSKGRGLAKKTSRLFSRGDRDRSGDGSSSGAVTPNSNSSLHIPTGSRQASYSSVASSETNGSGRHHFSSLNRPSSHNSANMSPPSHSRRLSHESQSSWQAASRSTRSGSTSFHESPTEGHQLMLPQSQSSYLGASVPNLSGRALPQPPNATNGISSANGAQTSDTFPTRMSTWFSHLLPSASSNAVAESSTSASASAAAVLTQVPPSPLRKPPSAAASFLSAARQRAVDGVRHLLDSEAQPDKCPDTMWVLGVPHPGWRPGTPDRSPKQPLVDLPIEENRRRGSGSSGKPSLPPKDEPRGMRPATWAKRKDPVAPTSPPTSPPSKAFSSLFSTSSLSLTLPGSLASGSPSRDAHARAGAADSPGKAKNRKAEKEVVKWPDQFYDDFRSRVWCTYRAQYAPILSLPSGQLIPRCDAYYSAFGPPADITPPRPASDSLAATSLPSRAQPTAWSWSRSGEERGLTSDAGWGCMLRTGQSMLANALIHLHLGRDWRLPHVSPTLEARSSADLADLEAYAAYARILSWFLDDPSPLCPFSVHRMALIGKELGKEVGEWFGPSTAAGALKTLTNSFPPCRLAVVTATDSMVYKSDIYAASHLVSDGWPEDEVGNGRPQRPSVTRHTTWGPKAVMILIGIRLGLDGVNPIYHDSIKMLFTFPQSIGIAGGRPSSSYYFVASQASSLFYLDPHLTRPAVPLEAPPSAPPSAGFLNDPDEAVIVEQPSPMGRESPVHVPYTLDVVDVDDLSDGSGSSASPIALMRGRQRSKAEGRKRGSSPATPPPVPPKEDSPSTPVTLPSPHKTPNTARSSSWSLSPPSMDAQTLWYANAYSDTQLRTFHCEKVKKMPLSGLDPSMLLGFMCRDEADFDDFCDRVSKLPQKIFTVQDEPPTWDDNDAAGLESVSEPEMDDMADEMTASGVAHDDDDDGGDEGNTTFDTMTIPAKSLARTRVAEEEEDWETKLERGSTPSSQPVLVDRPSVEIAKARPVASGRTRTESWVQTGREEYEAPNGASVI